ncbi:hypothetical protein QTN25_007434 [Entamoeba marina]
MSQTFSNNRNYGRLQKSIVTQKKFFDSAEWSSKKNIASSPTSNLDEVEINQFLSYEVYVTTEKSPQLQKCKYNTLSQQIEITQ